MDCERSEINKIRAGFIVFVISDISANINEKPSMSINIEVDDEFIWITNCHLIEDH